MLDISCRLRQDRDERRVRTARTDRSETATNILGSQSSLLSLGDIFRSFRASLLPLRKNSLHRSMSSSQLTLFFGYVTALRRRGILHTHEWDEQFKVYLFQQPWSSNTLFADNNQEVARVVAKDTQLQVSVDILKLSTTTAPRDQIS